jgi:hypothetical protein
MAYTLTIGLALGSSQTGLTLTAQLVDTTGANVGSAVTTGFVELGVGNYTWTYASFPDDFRGAIKFSSGATLKAIAAVNPQEAEYTDAKISTRLGTGYAGTITYTGPVATTGDVAIVHGDDYNNTDSRALEWSTTDSATWPDLTGATITLTVKAHAGGTAELTKTGTVVTPTGATKKVRVELTAANTTALGLGSHKFDVQATLSSGRIVTLITGTLNVLPDQT